MRCASSVVPSVAETSAWVSPRVKSAEPCTRGNTPISTVTWRIWSKARWSGRMRSLSTWSRKMFSRSSSKYLLSFLPAACVAFGQLMLEVVLELLDLGVALELGVLLGVERIGKLVAGAWR